MGETLRREGNEVKSRKGADQWAVGSGQWAWRVGKREAGIGNRESGIEDGCDGDGGTGGRSDTSRPTRRQRPSTTIDNRRQVGH
jgi:hypothetical protein